MDNIVNLTPHEVVVLAENLGDGHQPVLARYPSAGEARAEPRREYAGNVHVADVDGQARFATIRRVDFGPVAGLPEAEIGTAYIVSRITAVAARAEGRATADLLIPDEIVLDDDGRPVGCVAFSVL